MKTGNEAASSAILTAALLKQGGMLHTISLILSSCSFLVIAMHGLPGIRYLAVLAIGVAEFWFAVRVAVDARLFADIGDNRLEPQDLDKALQNLNLAGGSKGPRDLLQRSAAALRLLKIQAIILACQLLAFIFVALS